MKPGKCWSVQITQLNEPPVAAAENADNGNTRRPAENDFSKKVVFVPYFEGNPYQLTLMKKLLQQDIHVSACSKLRHVPFFGDESPDAIHLHWLPSFKAGIRGRVKLFGFCFRLRLARLLGKKVVWTVHNLYSHEGSWRRGEKKLIRRVLNAATGVIVHSPIAGDLVNQEFSPKEPSKIVIIPHGHYVDSYPNLVSRDDARKCLGISEGETVFLFLGLIRAYKGVDDLIDAFKHLDKKHTKLLIVGKPLDDATVCILKERIGGDDRIDMRPGYVPDDELQTYFNASDAVVYPYKDVLTSGALVLGMSFAKACIAPRIGCIPDYLDADGAFLYDADSEGALSNALARAYDAKFTIRDMGQHNLRKARQWDWSTIALQTSQLY